jgi:ABC-type multidrug transport system ATPase subunit
VRDRGELASPRASAAFLHSVTSAVARWCDAEDRVERARTWHRLAIAFVACAALYAVARSYGLDPLSGHLTGERLLSGSFSGAAVLGASLPAAYALAVHLDSWAIASSELSRLALNTSEPKRTKGTSLTRSPTLLRARDLTVRHGSNLALSLSNLELALGQPIGIAGPNGSGKTTFASVVAGLLAPTSGELLLDDCRAIDVDRDDVAFVPQDPVLIEPLSILENLRLVASEFAESDALALLRTLGLECSLETPAGNLSRGEQRRIAIARALLKKPKLLVLDEPDAWLDVAGRLALLATLRKAAASARVLIVSHRPDVLLQLETVIVLNAGHEIEGIDTPARLTEHSATFRAILGKEPANEPE